MNIVIDIETIPSQNPQVKADFLANVKAPGQYKKPESIAEWMRDNAESEADQQWRKTSFDGGLGHICCIGWSVDDEPAQELHIQSVVDEFMLLTNFYYSLHDLFNSRPNKRPVFIGHNLIDFDLRFIQQRSVILKVKPPIEIPFMAKTWDDSVFDTMKRWDAQNRTSLDKLSKSLGFSGKGDIDGSMVADYFADGRINEIAEYCKSDVELTRDVYKRMTFNF